MVGVLGGMFALLSCALCGAFVGSRAWAGCISALMGLLAILLGAFGSVFNTYSGLYLSKDNDLLLSMPIPVRSIMAVPAAGRLPDGADVLRRWSSCPPSSSTGSRPPLTPSIVIGGLLLLLLLISVLVLIALLRCWAGWWQRSA